MLLILSLCLAFLPQTSAALSKPSAVHDRAYWQSIVHNDFKVPAGASASELASELSGLLGSEDPQLRDGAAYEILTAWIYSTPALDDQTVRSLAANWVENLRVVPGTELNPVLRRSFSALMLSVVIARDNNQPFLSLEEFQTILSAALAYQQSETDLRGFDPQLGWIHSAAHTADLLKFLARSPRLDRTDQSALLTGIGWKLRNAPIVFVFGEDERYARAVLAIIQRPDFDAESFARWAAQLRPQRPVGTSPELSVLTANQNRKNVLAKLAFLLSLEKDRTANVELAQNAVRAAAEGTF